MPEEKNTKEGELVGVVAHYFDKIGVAVIDLMDSLKVGDAIKIIGPEIEFEQAVGSMEADHKKLKQAGKGDSVGLKVDQKAKEGYKVYKI